MKKLKNFFVLLSIIICAVGFIVGCGNKKETNNIEQIDFYFSKENAIQKEQEKSIFSINTNTEIKKFQKMIHDSTKIEGFLDVHFNYIVEMKNENNIIETLYLYLEDEKEPSGLYVNSKNTSVGFALNKDLLNMFYNTYQDNLSKK